MKLKLVILISGSGTNLQAIINACEQGLPVDILAVISDQPAAYGLTRAQLAHIPTHVVDGTQFKHKSIFEQTLQYQIDQYAPQLIVLAGFMRVLSPQFVTHYLGRMINIHPSLLPKYPGLNTHARVLADQESEHGASIHFVTPKVDGGPIICQSKINISSTFTVSDLQQRIHIIEHKIYPKALSWFAENRISMNHQQQILFDQKLLEKPILL